MNNKTKIKHLKLKLYPMEKKHNYLRYMKQQFEALSKSKRQLTIKIK